MSMSASVCVLVTVPTEQEELRQWNQPSKHFHRCSDWSRAPPTGESKARKQHSRALHMPDLAPNAPLESVLRRIASQLRLEFAFWSHDVTGAQLQARFDLLQDERYECLLCTLQEWGIGERPKSHVTAFSCLETRFCQSSMSGNPAATGTGLLATEGAGEAEGVSAASEEGTRVGWQSFMDSVRCRLNVNQVVRVVRRDATINFDFVVLLMAAALLSCVGLVENSFLFLSSSMLISPLMGPIIAGIFGSVIRDRGLRWVGIKNELIGIAISVMTGFVFGTAICLCGLGRFFVLSSGFTEEILSRCDTHSLAIGLCTALASGAAAAIGVLGGNTGSLVGVAISASLLPPAVNAGLLWAIALCTRVLYIDPQLLQSLAKHHDYSQHLHVELFVCATVSMALTLLNVVCVWLMGVVVLRIKEVAPAVQRDQHFWRHDVRLAREVALYDPELYNAIDRLDLDERRNVDIDAPAYQHTWSPGTVRSQLRPEAQVKEAGSNYHTVHGFQDFCITLHKLNSELTQPPPRNSQARPSFLEVFTPMGQAANSVPSAPSAASTPPPTTNTLSAQSTICNLPPVNNYRSLPDLRSENAPPRELSEPEPHSRSKMARCVHWRVERNREMSALPGTSQATMYGHSSQLLAPIPPDRQLRVMTRRHRSESDDSVYQDEFNV